MKKTVKKTVKKIVKKTVKKWYKLEQNRIKMNQFGAKTSKEWINLEQKRAKNKLICVNCTNNIDRSPVELWINIKTSLFNEWSNAIHLLLYASSKGTWFIITQSSYGNKLHIGYIFVYIYVCVCVCVCVFVCLYVSYIITTTSNTKLKINTKLKSKIKF